MKIDKGILFVYNDAIFLFPGSAAVAQLAVSLNYAAFNGNVDRTTRLTDGKPKSERIW